MSADIVRRNAMRATLLACLIAPLASFGEARTKWDFFIFVPTTHPVGAHAMGFADMVRKQTDGRLDITIRPPGELPYKATEVVRVVADGNVQLGDGISGWVGGETPVGGFLAMPYLISTGDDLATVWPKIEPILQGDLQRWGVRVLYHYYWPELQFWGARNPIRNLNDIKGRKIRVTNPESGYLVKQLGGEAVSFLAAETPMAMQRGMMDSLTTSILNLVGSKWNEFVKWGYLSNMNVSPSYVLINEAAYKALPKDVKTAVNRAAKETETGMLRSIPKLEADYREKLRAQGVQLIEQTVQDREQATKIMVPFWQAQAQQSGAATQRALRVIRESLRK